MQNLGATYGGHFTYIDQFIFNFFIVMEEFEIF